ncbi:flagellar filament capping protein FliD [Paenibacillus wynnii]|uniref:flagellar filament capping protein FliD n=1 Tax=Paenibacillus wynnii TaxID=268407 RepID=UPI002793071F|nr:flagellar filament capping protein FliD [Paenibacillus wynnii]MDQ0192179.1 flagellar hook-associated protein 2 [Paenibacillus wynnii]
MVLRVSGLASGIDVDSIVKETMTAKRVPLDKLNQQKQILQWQRDNYREMNSKLIDFKNNKLVKFDASSALNTQKAVVSGETTALKAEATAEANGIPMEIEVTQLAKLAAAKTSGANMIKLDGTRITSSSKLTDLQAINTNVSATGGKFSMIVNGKTIELDETLSISEAISKINRTEGANVTAKFDESSGQLTIASKTYAPTGTVTLDASNTFEQLFGTGVITTNAYQPAKITVNGSAAPLEYASNTFKLNGVQITLLAETTTSATITTETDSTKALETITNFVQTYNDLLSSLNTKTNEERYTEFTPLSDEQKKEMTDNDIEAWEKKAKSGMLKNDEILKSTISSMRSAITGKLGDLSSIGVTTGQYYENGKLYIDEEKLKLALQNDPQIVTSIFQGTTGVTNSGLFDKLSTSMNTAIDKLAVKAGTSKYTSDITAAFKADSTMGKRLTDYNTRISQMSNRLSDMENNLYKKFTAMETAINKYNSQSASLSSYAG